ncbi:MAG: hypothetical protein ABR976_03305 [Terracidiphilus sp.]|jgi:hypothetical protein
MPTHNDENPGRSIWQQPEDHSPEEIDVAAGYEKTDVGVKGIVVFLVSLGIFVAVTGILCYGIGYVFNAELNREDGPNSKWTKTADIRELGNLPNNPDMQKKVAEIAQQFPSPRVQLDDGNQDVADLHLREDLLLDNYTWVDHSQGKVRIPIERAMELIVEQNALKTVTPAQTSTLLTGDTRQGVVTTPLTDGFARTGYEQDLAAAEATKKPE